MYKELAPPTVSLSVPELPQDLESIRTPPNLITGKMVLDKDGPEALAQWVLKQEGVLDKSS